MDPSGQGTPSQSVAPQNVTGMLIGGLTPSGCSSLPAWLSARGVSSGGCRRPEGVSRWFKLAASSRPRWIDASW
jgi:hypothetical protein